MQLRLAAALLVLLVLPASPARAQDTESSGIAMYVEVGGSGLYYSVNYEGRVVSRVAARVGFMAVNQTIREERSETVVGVLLMPVMANVLLGEGSHRLELGAGPLIGLAGTGVHGLSYRGAEVAIEDLAIAGVTSSIGYRYQPRRGGLLFRATATPFYSASSAQLWGGLSIGWAM